jgi:hypothetical protein
MTPSKLPTLNGTAGCAGPVTLLFAFTIGIVARGLVGQPINRRRRIGCPCGDAPVAQEVNVLALFKGAEKFIFVYDDESRAAVVDAIRDAAADPKVAVNWFDAAVLTERARQQGMESENVPSRF